MVYASHGRTEAVLVPETGIYYVYYPPVGPDGNDRLTIVSVNSVTNDKDIFGPLARQLFEELKKQATAEDTHAGLTDIVTQLHEIDRSLSALIGAVRGD